MMQYLHDVGLMKHYRIISDRARTLKFLLVSLALLIFMIDSPRVYLEQIDASTSASPTQYAPSRVGSL